MRPLNKEEYQKLNDSLNHLSAIFRQIGIQEFSVSTTQRTLTWDNASQKVNVNLLEQFCNCIDEVYDQVDRQETKAAS